MKRGLLVEIICGLLAILFVYAATSKLLDYQMFELQLSKSPFLTSFSGVIAWSLPIAEIAIAFLIMFSYTRIAGLYASLFLMSLFTFYLIAMLNFSYYIPCSCGGVLGKLGWKAHIWFNVFFAAISICGILLLTKEQEQGKLAAK